MHYLYSIYFISQSLHVAGMLLPFIRKYHCIQGVPGGKVNIQGGHSIGHYKQKCLYECV
jgi:hypothetical protein